MRSISLFRWALVLVAYMAVVAALFAARGPLAAGPEAPAQSLAQAGLGSTRTTTQARWEVAELLSIALGALGVALWTGQIQRRALETHLTLGERERRLRQAEARAGLGHFEWDIPRQRVIWSEGAWRLFGRAAPADTTTPEDFVSYVHPDDQPRVRDELRALLAGRPVPPLEFRVSAADGERLLVGQGHLQTDPRGRPVKMGGYIQDVTASRAAQRALARFRAMLDQTHDCVLTFDPDSLHLLYVNRSTVEQVGYSAEQLLQMTPLDLQSELDEPSFRALIRPLIDGQESVLRLETHYRHRDGHEIPVEISLQLVSLVEGRSRFIAVVRDVSDRKHAEEHQRLLAQVFEHSREGIILTDAHRSILAVNEAYCRITGYTAEEVRESNPALLTSGLGDAGLCCEIWESVEQSGHWQGEVTDRRRDGNLLVWWLSVTQIADAEGRVTNHVATFRDLSRQKAAQARIRRLAYFDQLTGLPNRALLTERAGRALREAQLGGHQVALMFLDLDHFKHVNDTLGHSSGDHLLVQLAERLVASLRGTDTVSRLGGDEFILLLPATDEAGATKVAQTLLSAIGRPCRVKGHELSMTASIGVAVYPQDGTNLPTLMKSADTAMYRAKGDGRNGFRFFTSQMHHLSARQLSLGTALRTALEDHQLFLHYQPQVALDRGTVAGVEALLRWRHPRLGLIPPGEFIPLAEETALILPIGEWAMRMAVRQRKAWLDRGLAAGTLAVNLSAAQFRQPDLPALVARIVEEEGLPAELLELELTETVAAQDPAGAIIMMDELARLGVRLAIDDFGTGHASLGYLKRFHVDKLKIDRSFVKDLGHDPEGEAIVKAVIGLAQSLSYLTCAEGVETAEQLEFLRALGCDQVQGFLFSRPVPPDEVVRFFTYPQPMVA